MNKFENFKFTFETNEAYEAAQRTGYVPEFDMVRAVVEREGDYTVDFPVPTRQELMEMYERYSNITDAKIVNVYQSVHHYDINDYIDYP